MDVTPEDFVADKAWVRPEPEATNIPDQLIDGVRIDPLLVRSDPRGELVELLTTRDNPIDPIVHVYKVTAEAGSVRAWVYHDRQTDRLTYTEGDFRIVLYDIRDGSPTKGLLNVFDFGAKMPVCLHIPAFVVHGVQNRGERASFVNMPTRAYDPARPDKQRLPHPDPRIPYVFS